MLQYDERYRNYYKLKIATKKARDRDPDAILCSFCGFQLKRMTVRSLVINRVDRNCCSKCYEQNVHRRDSEQRQIEDRVLAGLNQLGREIGMAPLKRRSGPPRKSNLPERWSEYVEYSTALLFVKGARIPLYEEWLETLTA